MQQSYSQRPSSAAAVLGVLLIAVGAITLGLREVGVNLLASVGAWGWPFFILVPGVILLAASLVPTRPRGIGFAIAGAIITTIGAQLLYQSRTGHWESWAYAWALIPMSASLAMVLYGLYARTRGLVTSGLWMAGIAALLFAAGAWYFEGIFAGEPQRLDIGLWWPVAVIAVGALLVVRALLVAGRADDPMLPPPSTPPTDGPPTA